MKKIDIKQAANGEVLDTDAYLKVQVSLYGGHDLMPRFLYKPFTPLPDLSSYLGHLIEVRVHKCYVVRHNKAFRERLFYGQD